MTRSSSNTYVLYEREDGTFASHWQYRGRSTVPGCLQGRGGLYPPPFALVVTAKSAKQAHYFANNSITTRQNDGLLGVCWFRESDSDSAPPLTADITRYPTLISWCGNDPTFSMWNTLEDARTAARWLREIRCGGRCCCNHEIVEMTLAEAVRRQPCWLAGPMSWEEWITGGGQ